MTTPADPEPGLPATEAGRALLAQVVSWWDPDAPQEEGRTRFVKDILAIEAEAQRAPGDGGLAAANRDLTDALEQVITYAEGKDGIEWSSVRMLASGGLRRACRNVNDIPTPPAIPPAPPSAGVWVTAEGLARALCTYPNEIADNHARFCVTLGQNDHGAARALERVQNPTVYDRAALGPSAQEGASGE